ncbi:MAG TPA: hypothetical protein PK640_18195 [Verrucomicrobiota bacterium]|nr:hypothetical protein [Verrucomicrobiota bacterium]
MKTNPVATFTKLLSSATLGFLLAGSLFSAVAGDLVPYKGTIWGEIPFSVATGAFVAAYDRMEPVNEISSHLGRGTQEYSQISFSQDENTGILTCSGISQCYAANGDMLLLEFELVSDNAFIFGMPFTYTGRFWILPDGTGRFAFPDTGELGGGTLFNGAGIASVSSDGSGVLPFSHDFEGTIAVLRKSPKKSK